MTQINFPELEKEILDFWEANGTFQKSLDKPSPRGEFVFYEGPPTANGKPGIHHVLARAFKDLLPRFKTMQGYHVARKAGWDTHGLPVELQVEKELGISGKPDIENIKGNEYESVAYFNEQCRTSVWQYQAEWEKLTRRMGYWIDLEHPYITYENDYIETLWWIFKQVYDKELLYKGHKVVPHCPRCGTALSSHEVAQGYKEVTEPSVYLKFKVKTGNEQVHPGDFILSWTTTPWTLPGNVALAVSEKVNYAIVYRFGDTLKASEKKELEVNLQLVPDSRLILAENLIDKVFLGLIRDKDYKVEAIISGTDLIGIEYEPLFPGAIPSSAKNYDNAFKVYAADFVTTEDGTGVVHTAVMYGEDDYNLGEAVELPKYHTVDEEGKFKFENHEGILGVLNGLTVKHKDKTIEEKITELINGYLNERGNLLKIEPYKHDYPFCWRCDTPLLYYAKDSWFIKMSAMREQLNKNNEQINWVPEHIKAGRFGEWLGGAKDWAISRERYWGTPLPIWQCEQCQRIRVIGSRQELEELGTGFTKTMDLHRPYIDEVTLTCDCGGRMRRDKAVADCWFDSGSMPFAQLHYPFENQELIDKEEWYPADFICEAIDQTRGWFYTLLAIATLLDRGAPYKNVICLGHINDKDGKKMSKRLGNIVDPWQIMETYGADALRFHMYTMNQPGEPKNFDPRSVEEVVKKNWLILWNVYSFYSLYSDIKEPIQSDHVLDRWVIAKLKIVARAVTDSLTAYDVTGSARVLTSFIDELSTWYVRRSRERFKAGGEAQAAAVTTLGYILFEFSKLLAPFAPFLSEKLYQELIKTCPVKDSAFAGSVHLESWPQAPEASEDERLLLQQMQTVRDVVTQALAIRAEAQIKLRQPLRQLSITETGLPAEFMEILREEVNVKSVQTGAERLGVDTNLDEELLQEGLFRDIVRSVNNLRKAAKLKPGDKVVLYLYATGGRAEKLIERYGEALQTATASREVVAERKELEFSTTVGQEADEFFVGIKSVS